MKRRRIILQYGQVSKLAKIFDCSTVCINHALRYITDSTRASEIRTTALEKFGGQIIEYDSDKR
nr:MAG TPA: hypothetical protein [Caudoviricetes sp.]